ncbi:MAG TPA: benzoyl-CoA reductase subunit C [Bacteroidetes bacterium]|nr:benzoyl-CoA reductase subunit C [Bacteroidota bacterium]
MSVKQIIKKCEQLYNDIDLFYVQEWKEKHKSRAIGFMPVYVPRELIHAAGMLPVGIMGAGDLLEIIKGDAYFQSYICHIPRSTIELGISNRLDCLDGMLFPAICDVIRNLSGMFKLMFKDMYVKYIDFPQNFLKTLGGNFYQHELRTMSDDFSQINNVDVNRDDLNRSIKLYNENRAVIKELYDLRSQNPHLVPGSELYLLMRASNVLEITEYTALLREYISETVCEKRPQRDNIRVVVTGVFCEQPPLALIRALENSGCFIVDDDWMLGARFILGDVALSNDPINALADAYLNHTVCTASKYDQDGNKGAFLIEQVKKAKAEGVIFAAPSFCDPALLERPMQQKALNRENIPYTSFKYSENTGQFQVIKEQTGTFADSIKLWGDS